LPQITPSTIRKVPEKAIEMWYDLAIEEFVYKLIVSDRRGLHLSV